MKKINFIPYNSKQLDERVRRLKRVLAEFFPLVKTTSLNFRDCTAAVFGFENNRSLSKKISDNNKLEVKQGLLPFDEALSSTIIKQRRELQAKRLADYALKVKLPELGRKAEEIVEHWKPSAERRQHTTYGIDELQAFADSGEHVTQYKSLNELVGQTYYCDSLRYDMSGSYHFFEFMRKMLKRRLKGVDVIQIRSWHQGLKTAEYIGADVLVSDYLCDLAIVAINILHRYGEGSLSKVKALLEIADEYQELTALKSTLAAALIRIAFSVDCPSNRIAYLKRALLLCKAVARECKVNGISSVFTSHLNLVEFYQHYAFLNWELQDDKTASLEAAAFYYNEAEKIRTNVAGGHALYISEQWARELEGICYDMKGGHHE